MIEQPPSELAEFVTTTNDIESLRIIAACGLIASHLVEESINACHQNILAEASPEELSLVEEIMFTVKAAIAQSNHFAASMMVKDLNDISNSGGLDTDTPG